mmetsp:Transcript_88912/g.250878  ORF Transcript_88912/g.250878 Transcript_88912/m.250878 type:complete len:143 (+) Transcript_88912:342-770(+)
MLRGVHLRANALRRLVDGHCRRCLRGVRTFGELCIRGGSHAQVKIALVNFPCPREGPQSSTERSSYSVSIRLEEPVRGSRAGRCSGVGSRRGGGSRRGSRNMQSSGTSAVIERMSLAPPLPPGGREDGAGSAVAGLLRVLAL